MCNVTLFLLYNTIQKLGVGKKSQHFLSKSNMLTKNAFI